jgi:hypothetical protein
MCVYINILEYKKILFDIYIYIYIILI